MALIDLDHPEAGLAVITLNRPDSLNALSFDLIEELHRVIADVGADSAVRVVILTGAGRAFCAGTDLRSDSRSSRSRGLTGVAAGMRGQEHVADLVPALAQLPQPVIAAVNGVAVGGGLALALACDLRVAVESARFNAQFINVGLSGTDLGISYTLPRLIGAAKAWELIYTGRFFDAAEADHLGLLTRVVPDGQARAGATALAERLLEKAPFGLAMTKEALWANLDGPSLDAAIHVENRNQVLAAQDPDFAEFMAAFAEGRPPRFGADRGEG
jgi:enoyl-CoA hydratase/carnithine racemase